MYDTWDSRSDATQPLPASPPSYRRSVRERHDSPLFNPRGFAPRHASAEASAMSTVALAKVELPEAVTGAGITQAGVNVTVCMWPLLFVESLDTVCLFFKLVRSAWLI